MRMSIKDKIELVSKTVDALYKKLVVLVVISGGFGAYAIKFVQESHWVGYIFICAFIFVSIGVFITYVKLNKKKKKIERMSHE